MYDALTEQMELKDLRLLRDFMPKDYRLSVRVLNMLWVNFSNDQEKKQDYARITKENVDRFVIWVESGNPDDAQE